MEKKCWIDIDIWKRVMLAFLGTYGICYLGNIAGIPHALFSVMSAPLAAVVFGLLGWTDKRLQEISDERNRRRRARYGAVLGFLFSVTMIAGYQLQTFDMTGLGVKGKVLLLVRAGCLGIAVFPFGDMLFAIIGKIPCRHIQEGLADWKKGKVFAVSAAVIFLCLIPVWLAYYPIIMSYDFHRQVGEASKGFAWFWPFQPLIHTWLIWLFLQVGYLVGDLQTGMACMALFQMIVYSLVSGYACVFLYRILKKKWAVIAGILFFGVFPLNSVLMLCTTKDALFGTLFLLFILLLAERFFYCVEGRRKLVVEVLLLLEGCIMVQFRNNCIYALAVFGVLWVLAAAKREKLRVLLLCILLVAGGKATGIAIKAAIGTQLGTAKVEMYSVPIQQFARVGYYHSEELDGETRQMLNSYIPQENWQDYDPSIADAVKGTVAVTTFQKTWDGHMAQLLSDWLRLGIRYPNDYLDAFLELTRGYWFLDDRSYAECLGYGEEGRMGTIYTYNVSIMDDGTEIVHESKFPWLEEQLEKIVSGNIYYNWPVISILFKCAFYFWALMVVWTAFWYRRQKQQAVLCLFPLLYMGTMLLGPVVQMRYIFPIMISLPVLACLLLVKEER